MFNVNIPNGIQGNPGLQRLNLQAPVNAQRLPQHLMQSMPQRPAMPQPQVPAMPAVPRIRQQVMQHPALQQAMQNPQLQQLMQRMQQARPQGAPVAAPQQGRMMAPGFAMDGFQPPQKPDFQIQPVGNPQMLPPAPETWSMKY